MLELLVAASPHTLQQLHLTTVQGLIETSNLFRVIDALSRIENLRSLALGDVVLLEKDVPKTMPPVPVGMLSRLERLAIFTEATSALTVLDLLAKVELPSLRRFDLHPYAPRELGSKFLAAHGRKLTHLYFPSGEDSLLSELSSFGLLHHRSPTLAASEIFLPETKSPFPRLLFPNTRISSGRNLRQ
ncbi:hypothetical protein CC2G_007000 [Coprinopsis cinerea AmutBmut pab1-1]|nr:hypothetical protein CC2G_007000 [Coprinopsis cinerea AmutBmut pab1-1]